MKEKFYITYGLDDVPNQPYKGGWTLVYAEDEDEAREKHQQKYGLSRRGCLRFAFIYTEKAFIETRTYKGCPRYGEQWDVIE